MNFYTFAIAFGLVVLFAMLLPIISGIGSFKMRKPQNGNDFLSSKDKRGVNFQLSKDASGEKGSAVSSSANRKAGRFDIDSKTGLKKRVIGKFDADPNNYDYDVNELINEDQTEESQEQAKRLQKYDGSKEKAYEELV